MANKRLEFTVKVMVTYKRYYH